MGVEGRDRSIILECYNFALGKKTLSLDINLTAYTASARFGNRSGLFHRRFPHETTQIFSLADQKLTEVARRINHPITLTFDSADSKLKLWMMDQAEIFKFNSITPNDPKAFRETVTKIYKP